ncbi:MAG: DNA recombination protein RmuC [Verrucomicrobia bacterium]|nr:DNA recombination protein RmuC [Verrucomicrobiota bacterium]
MFDSIAVFVAGLCAGGIVIWLLAQSRSALQLARVAALETELAFERKATQEKRALLDDAQSRLSEAFQALSAEALRRNNSSFLELANLSLQRFQDSAKGDLEKRQTAITELVKPVRESLDKVDAKIQEIEKTRAGAYEALTTQVRAMMEAQGQLRAETNHLATALRSPVVRGRWGEVQLRRVVELAGMLAHCDFVEQSSVTTETGRQRPDVLVRLPGGRQIVVDAKAPLAAYLEALEARDEETRLRKFAAHAGHLRAHIEALSKKAYWEQFAQAPEFVVLFLPGESFFSAALEHDPALIEYGTERRVILATPTTLISLLKAVFYGWRQERLAENADEISRLGRELYKRLADMSGHMERMGRSLNSAVEHFNKLAATTESRVLVTARKFRELEPAQPGEELDSMTQVETVARQLQAPELAPSPVREHAATNANVRKND